MIIQLPSLKNIFSHVLTCSKRRNGNFTELLWKVSSLQPSKQDYLYSSSFLNRHKILLCLPNILLKTSSSWITKGYLCWFKNNSVGCIYFPSKDDFSLMSMVYQQCYHLLSNICIKGKHFLTIVFNNLPDKQYRSAYHNAE